MGRPNLPNVIRIVWKEWKPWLARGERASRPATEPLIGCKKCSPRTAFIKISGHARQNRSLLPEGSRRVRQCSIEKDTVMGEGYAPMAAYTALIEQLCAKRATLVQAMAANPEQITAEQIRNLAWLQSAFLAVEAEHRRAERETLHKEVQERTGTLSSLP